MARLRRIVATGCPHHVTQRGVRRQKTFFEERDYEAYIRTATRVKKECDIEVWAYCLMPNHIHMVVVPNSTDALAKFFGKTHSSYARRTNKYYDWTGHLWQERFFSVPMDEAHTIVAMRYVESNPIRAGLCRRVEDWRWSSVHGNLGTGTDALLDRHLTKALVPDWGAIVYGFSDVEQVEVIRRQTRIGRPIGNDQFLNDLEIATGLTFRKQRPGRKSPR